MPSSPPNICPLCRQAGVFAHLETHQDSGITYDLFECSLCRAQFWLPLKNPGSVWYERDERYAGANNDPTLEPNWNHKKVISFLKSQPDISNKNTKRVFDIGCGTGNFLAHAKKNNWHVWGIDFDRNAVAASQEVFKLPNIEVATLEEFYAKHTSDQDRFDLITFYDVFEHIDNHNEFIEMIKNLLVPGGYISMSMPYRKSARWLQPNDLPPRHLTRWDRNSLSRFLVRHGFKVEYIKRVPASFYAILMKLRFKYGKHFSFNVVNKMRDVSVAKNQKDPRISKTLAKKSFKVKLIHTLAKIKDLILFGIPAFFMWLALIPFAQRYNGLFMIARYESH